MPVRIAVVVQLLNCVQLFATPRTAAHQAYLSFTISQSLLKPQPPAPHTSQYGHGQNVYK